MIQKVLFVLILVFLIIFLIQLNVHREGNREEKPKYRKTSSKTVIFEESDYNEENVEEIIEENEEEIPKLELPEKIIPKIITENCKECPRFYINDENCKCIKNKIRICIITNEFKGIDLHGGIGSEYFRLSKLLKEEFLVTIGFVNYPYCEQEPNTNCKWEDWKIKYKEMDITFEPILTNSTFEGTLEMKNSYKSYLWLKERQNNFDIVHFHDYLGVGYYSFIAKSLGIDFLNVILVNGLHGTSWFVNRAQNRSPYDKSHLIMKYIEEKTIEYSELVISPSQFYLNWLKENHVNLPETKYILPNLIDKEIILNQNILDGKIDHIVFFGRFSKVKGLDIFIEAINELSKEKINLKVTFLGNSESQGIQGMSVQKFFQIQSKNWKFNFDLITGKDSEYCMKYLSQKGRLAVIPSRTETFSLVVLELIFNKIPFIASKVGGIPEIVSNENNLFEPNSKSLFDKIKEVLSKGITIPSPKYSIDGINDLWIKWHKNIYQNYKKNKQKIIKSKLITIIITCYHIDHLKLTLDHLQKQTFKYFNIIIIDFTMNANNILNDFNEFKSVVLFGYEFDLLKLLKKSFEISNGEYLLFLNSGDLPDEKMIEMYNRISFIKDYDIIYDAFIGLSFETFLLLNQENTWMIKRSYLLKNFKYNDLEIQFCKFKEIILEYILKNNENYIMIPMKLNHKLKLNDYDCKDEILRVYQENAPYYLYNSVKFLIEN